MVDGARELEQRATRPRFELPPGEQCLSGERDVVVRPVALAEDAGGTVRRAAIVGALETFEEKDGSAALCEAARSGGSDDTGADHHDVDLFGQRLLDAARAHRASSASVPIPMTASTARRAGIAAATAVSSANARCGKRPGA